MSSICKKHFNLLMRQEGYRQFPYLDSKGFLTVGYGRNLKTVGISKREAELLLSFDIIDAEKQLSDEFSWFRRMDEARQGVVTNMCFNMGFEKLSDFYHLLNDLSKKDYHKASEDMMDSLWAEQVPNRAKVLSRIMETGEIE